MCGWWDGWHTILSDKMPTKTQNTKQHDFQVSETRFKQREGLETILSQHYTPDKLEMCFMQENTLTQVVVVEDITEGNKDTTKSVVDMAEDISENTISDNSDRNPRVLPSVKYSSSNTIKYLSFLQIICLVLTLIITV